MDIYLRFIFICVFLADPSQQFFLGGTPSYGEAYRREKADSRGWGGAQFNYWYLFSRTFICREHLCILQKKL